MITEINRNRSATTKIFKIDMAGMHPDQEPEEYFASQLDILIIQQYEHNWEYKSTIGFHDGWMVVFIDKALYT